MFYMQRVNRMNSRNWQTSMTAEAPINHGGGRGRSPLPIKILGKSISPSSIQRPAPLQKIDERRQKVQNVAYTTDMHAKFQKVSGDIAPPPPTPPGRTLPDSFPRRSALLPSKQKNTFVLMPPHDSAINSTKTEKIRGICKKTDEFRHT